MVRAFVALELSPEIKEQLTAAQDVLRGCRARLTFVEPALIHITTKFLGEIAEQKIPAVRNALRKVQAAPFLVTAHKITVNNPSRPHTVWCTIEDAGESGQVFQGIEDALFPLGFSRETRTFTPHATVARVKSPDLSLFAAISQLNNRKYGSCMISGMKLKKSTLTPQGPVYEDLLEVRW
ncbi:MAG: RNA 2',3'-cyclic phosphodiesterase [Methanoregula sp.]|nr:RNA 2',3'-cyclic phosphodiesterase [Methanoregula sp.]